MNHHAEILDMQTIDAQIMAALIKQRQKLEDFIKSRNTPDDIRDAKNELRHVNETIKAEHERHLIHFKGLAIPDIGEEAAK